MSLFDKIMGLFGPKSGAASGAPLMLVLDGAAYLAGGRGRPGPRDLLALLSRLGRFATREKVKITVLFESDPLHRAGDGDELNGVTVYYVASPEERTERLWTLYKQLRRGSRVVVVSADPGLEKRVQAAGGEVLRASTFAKAVEAAEEEGGRPMRGDGRGGEGRGGGDRGGEGRGGGRDDQGGGRRRGRRGPPRRGPREGGGRDGGREGGGREGRPSASGGEDKVRELLDVVE